MCKGIYNFDHLIWIKELIYLPEVALILVVKLSKNNNFEKKFKIFLNVILYAEFLSTTSFLRVFLLVIL